MPGFDPSCIDVAHMLESLEIRNISRATEHELRFSCPYPAHIGGDERPSCYMNIHTSAFFCHGCKEKGNAINFVSHTLGVTPLEATRLLREKYGGGGIDPDHRDVMSEVMAIINAGKEESAPQPKVDEQVLQDMLVDWDKVETAFYEEKELPHSLSYYPKRGFSAEVLNDWEFGFDPISNRPVFPVRDNDGTLIGFKGRAVYENQHPKYFILGDKPGRDLRYGFPCYQPSKVVFGAYRIKQSDKLIVCEGELNAISVCALGIDAVAINGSHFSDHHADIIKNKTDSVVLFLDSDKAGHEAVWGRDDSDGQHHPGIVERLSPYVDVSICPDREGDAASMTSKEIEECIAAAKGWLSIRVGAC